MTTIFDKVHSSEQAIDLGREFGSAPVDFEVPSCTIEDVDRSVYDLFKTQLPLFYAHEREMRRVHVIFATGERFAILSRREPLRDPSGAIILPLISITRSSLTQGTESAISGGQRSPIKIVRRLHVEDARYQNLANKLGLRNQLNVAIDSTLGTHGRLATRRRKSTRPGISYGVPASVSNDNIYEIITVAPVKYFTCEYKIAIWANFMQESNDLITTIMSGYQDNYGRAYRLETPKGYWFVGRVTGDIGQGSNFDSFSSEERIVRQEMSMQVTGYIINPKLPGVEPAVRSFVSAPQVEFTIQDFASPEFPPIKVGAPEGQPDRLVLQDLSTLDDPLPGSGVAGQVGYAPLDTRNDLRREPYAADAKATVGGYSSGASTIVDSMGHRVRVKVSSKDSRNGETVVTPLDDFSF